MKEKALSVLLVDDDPHAIQVLENLMEPFDEIKKVFTAKSVEEGIRHILNNNPDLVFLDIDMPGKNGFELIHELNALNINTTIIFQTAFPEYSIEAIRHQAFDYLVKPVNPIELKKTIIRFFAYWSKNRLEKPSEIHKFKVQFKIKGGSVFINPNDIIFINAEGNYSELQLKDKKTKVVTMPLIRVLEKLKNKDFLRINRSNAINVTYLKELDRKNRIVLLNYLEREYRLNVGYKYLKVIEDYFN